MPSSSAPLLQAVVVYCKIIWWAVRIFFGETFVFTKLHNLEHGES